MFILDHRLKNFSPPLWGRHGGAHGTEGWQRLWAFHQSRKYWARGFKAQLSVTQFCQPGLQTSRGNCSNKSQHPWRFPYSHSTQWSVSPTAKVTCRSLWAEWSTPSKLQWWPVTHYGLQWPLLEILIRKWIEALGKRQEGRLNFSFYTSLNFWTLPCELLSVQCQYVALWKTRSFRFLCTSFVWFKKGKKEERKRKKGKEVQIILANGGSRPLLLGCKIVL